LKVGVVGLGRLGSVYVRDLAGRIPETTVVAVADSDRALADRIAEQFDVPKAYGSAQDLIADRDVDAVVIVSPTHTHREVVVAAAQSRKPTFCEKPPAISLAECAAMRTPSTIGNVLSDGFMRRFDPDMRRRKRRLGRARLGGRWSSNRRRAIRSVRASIREPAAAAASW
jgi:scyllo-inositol 2-dehydrogenase (NAD+)